VASQAYAFCCILITKKYDNKNKVQNFLYLSLSLSLSLTSCLAFLFTSVGSFITIFNKSTKNTSLLLKNYQTWKRKKLENPKDPRQNKGQ
jgi:hypothetical protein